MRNNVVTATATPGLPTPFGSPNRPYCQLLPTTSGSPNPHLTSKNTATAKSLPTTAKPQGGSTAITATPLEGVASGSNPAVAPQENR